MVTIVAARGTPLPPCTERPTFLLQPWVDARLWCIELVIHDESGGELGFTALATAPNAILYAARPLAGEVFELSDSNGDLLPDAPHLVAGNLTLPNGLAYYDGALYISGGANIYRLQDGNLDILVDDLPSGAGFWTGGLAIGSNKRIYVAIGAPCDFCVPEDTERGTILSFNLDGGDKQLVASGLRQPADIAFHMGALWTVDSARDGLNSAEHIDELNRVVPGAHFGWPYCVGTTNERDFATNYFDCRQAQPPAFAFPTFSQPLGIASYSSDTFPTLNGTLLVVLAGKREDVNVTGYRLVAVHFDEEGNPLDTYDVVPNTDGLGRARNARQVNYGGFGFWPHRPIDVAVSEEGWIYVSAGGGQIFVLRPP